jgi:hypothetical protein
MTAQSKRRWSIVSIYATAAALVGILGYVVRAQDIAYNAMVKPSVEQTVGGMIHDSIAGCKARMEKLELKQCQTDTNILIIKSLLEVMATNDQLLKAQARRSNPTGIR